MAGKGGAWLLGGLLLAAGTGVALAVTPGRRHGSHLGGVVRGIEQPEATIELTCVMIEDPTSKVEMCRAAETRQMWARAARIAKQLKIRENFSEHVERGTIYGDAYLYPTLDKLEQTINALERDRVDFDNIDLPPETPKALTNKLRKQFPRGSGIMVNT